MNKIIFTIVFAVIALLFATNVNAIVSNYAPYANGLSYGMASYGSHPVNSYYGGVNYPYASQPVRIGGWFGGNGAFLVGLRPGYYDGPVMNYNTRYQLASNYYPRAGGNFGYYNGGSNYYYNLRPGTFSYSGPSTNYGSPNYYYRGPM